MVRIYAESLPPLCCELIIHVQGCMRQNEYLGRVTEDIICLHENSKQLLTSRKSFDNLYRKFHIKVFAIVTRQESLHILIRGCDIYNPGT